MGGVTLLGVDPGLTGAVAVLHGDDLEVFDMPVSGRAVDAAILASELRRLERPEVVVVERQQAFPRQGVSSAFKGGVGYGIVLGVLATLGWRVEIVAAGAWKKAVCCPADKDGARARASDVFPGYAYLWCRVKDHGRAEAALIAWHGRRLL